MNRLVAFAALLTLACVTALVTPLAAMASPRQKPAPTVASVTAQLDKLGRTIENLAEKYNRAKIQVAAAQRASTAAKRDVIAASSSYNSARERYVELVRADYEGGNQSSTGALLVSGSPSDYLDRLTAMNILTRHANETVTSVDHLNTVLKGKQKAASTALTAAKKSRQSVATQRAEATAETKRLKTLLATLTAKQQQAFANQNSVSPAKAAVAVKSVHAGSAAAQRAVDFALAQVGKPYVFGAAGPDSYDCSGLTMAAWAAGGVSLPHLAADQINYGTNVGADELQPGDLVFLYNPIGHVDIYIGNGMMVSAPQTGENVKIVPFSYYRSDFSGATRLA